MAWDAESPPKTERSFSALLSDLAAETGTLLRQEISLFKAELSENLGRAGRGVGFLVAGALLAFSGWLALLAAAILGLALVLPGWAAALIVGGVVLGIAGLLLWLGRSRIAPEGLVPRRTLESLREDEAWVREQFR